MTRIVKFSECVQYMIKGPFGSDMKKSLYVPKGNNTYKVYIQGNAIQQDETLGDYYVSEEYFHEKLERFEVHPGDYIITCDGTLGKFIKLSDSIERGVISSSLLLLKLNEEIINDKYFELLWEHTMLATLASRARNACLVHLPSAKAIGDLEVELPEMGEQLEIAEKAFSVKRNIAYREKQQELLDELIKARFVELFGHPDLNEKDWKVNTFGKICTVRQGLQIPISKRLTEYEKGCYEYITVQYLHGGKEREYIKDPKRTVICTKDDVLMTRTGNTGMVITGVDGVFHNNFFLIDFDRNKYDKDFLVQYLNLDVIQADIRRRAGTSTIPDLNHGDFYKIQIFEPPMRLQSEFNAFLKQVDKSKSVVRKSLNETRLLYDCLMQEFF